MRPMGAPALAPARSRRAALATAAASSSCDAFGAIDAVVSADESMLFPACVERRQGIVPAPDDERPGEGE